MRISYHPPWQYSPPRLLAIIYERSPFLKIFRQCCLDFVCTVVNNGDFNRSIFQPLRIVTRIRASACLIELPKICMATGESVQNPQTMLSSVSQMHHWDCNMFSPWERCFIYVAVHAKGWKWRPPDVGEYFGFELQLQVVELLFQTLFMLFRSFLVSIFRRIILKGAISPAIWSTRSKASTHFPRHGANYIDSQTVQLEYEISPTILFEYSGQQTFSSLAMPSALAQ